MVLGPRMASLLFWALKSLSSCFGLKKGKMVLMYKKIPMGGMVDMSLYEVVSRRLYP